MLGSARQADFDQEAANRQLAKAARPAGRSGEPVAASPAPKPKRRGWLLGFVTRDSRAQA
jgi:hypothetical protein